MGTRLGTRLAACSSSSATGSGRSGAGAHRPWLDLGASLRASRPLATRSSTVRWARRHAEAKVDAGACVVPAREVRPGCERFSVTLPATLVTLPERESGCAEGRRAPFGGHLVPFHRLASLRVSRAPPDLRTLARRCPAFPGPPSPCLWHHRRRDRRPRAPRANCLRSPP